MWDAWVGPCISLFMVFCLCTLLEGVQCSMHSTYNSKCLPSTTHLSIQGNTLEETSQVDFWAGKGVDQRIFGPVALPYL